MRRIPANLTKALISACSMVLFALIAFSGAATGQEDTLASGASSAQTGITGVVQDSSGAVLPGVIVEATSLDRNEKIAAELTDGEGRYTIKGLKPGVYEVTFSLSRFKTLKREGVEVQPHSVVALVVEMSVASLQESIMVTARERAEDIQTVPQSIAAFIEDDLAAESAQRLSDLGQVTPNFLYGQKIQSGSSAGQIYIRGIGQQDTNVQFSPGVGIYVDGVYLGRAQANDLDLADVERVEVLYGPQGTLFGKNSNGGALNIVTRRPDASAQKPTGMFEAQTGNFGRFDARGLLDVPLVPEKSALQAAVAGWRQEGYSKRVLDGEDQANQNRIAGRVQLLLRPTDTFESVIGLDGTAFDERSAAYRLVEVRTSSPVPILYATMTPYRYDNRWVTKSDYQYDGTGPNKNAGDVWGASLNLTWKQSWGSLKSITAYRKLHVESDFDPDGSPLTVLDVFNPVDQHQISQEVQAVGTSFNERLHWVTGVYYFREKAQDIQPLNIALEVFHGVANLSYNNWVVNQNPALYGQGTFDLTTKLKLTAGARLAEDFVDAQRDQTGYPIPTIQQPLVSRSANWTSFLPRLGLDYQWTPHLMTYVSAAEGSKSGGYNGRAASIQEFTRFEPEKVWAYEAGLRSDWFNQRVRFNATGYYSDYHDFQIQLNASTTDSQGHPVAVSYVGNIPKAKVSGGEFSLTITPIARLLLSAGLGITDGKYLTYVPGAPVTTKSQFVNAPRTTFTVGSTYWLTLRNAGQITCSLDYIRKSTIQYDYSNSPLVAQPPYGLLNARLTWQPPHSHLSFFGFGTNLTHSHYALGGIDDGPNGSLGEVTKMMGAPLEWGIGGNYRF